MPIAILGTGRSGTSMIARMLNLSGLYMGEEEGLWNKRLDPRMNPTGFWEQREIHTLMGDLFDHLGGTWENPPQLAPGWENDASLEPFYTAAHEIIDRVFGGHENWTWKLPKTAVVVPFWRRVVPDLRFLICVRNPLDFAVSLGKYTPNSRSHLLAMWQYYNFHILCETKPEERCITFYEDYFPCYRTGLDPVLEFAGLPSIEPDGPIDQQIRRFCDPELKHYTSTVQDVLGDSTVPYVTRQLYQELLRAGPFAHDIPILQYRDMLLPLLELALVGEGTLDGTGAVSRAEYNRLKRKYRLARWWDPKMFLTRLKGRFVHHAA